jgi:N-carbamoylputrescine amidase
MVRIAGIQFQGSRDREANVVKAISLVREAAHGGAQVLCLPELFNTMYFCVGENAEFFQWAETIPGPTSNRMADLSRETHTVLVCPLFEKVVDGEYYNTAVILGPDGEIIGKYRKMSIPLIWDREKDASDPRGNEKFYFRPGDLGFPVFSTPFGINVGLLICYDRHFPEAARILGLRGADVVFVPTATSGKTRYLWEMGLKAHAAMNIYYVCGVNKVGKDIDGSARNHFGASMIVNPRGEILAQAGDKQDEIIYADVDTSLIRELKHFWNFYRDRRPEFYGPLVEQ